MLDVAHPPPPPVPPDCDLRALPWLPLDARALRDGSLAAGDAEVFRAALLAKCAAWHQVPAASLPDDDVALAHLLGFGRDVRTWRRLRAAGALRDFERCADGRLYNHALAARALGAWASRQMHTAKQATGRERTTRWRERQRETPSVTRHAADSVTRHAAETETRPQRAVEGEGNGEEHGSAPDGAAAEPASPSPAAAPPPDARATLWTEGLARLRRITGRPDRAARTLLGQLLRDAADDCAAVAALLHQAEADGIGDPAPWLQAAIAKRFTPPRPRVDARGDAAAVIKFFAAGTRARPASQWPDAAVEIDGIAERVP